MRAIELTNGGFLLVNEADYGFMSSFTDWKRKEASSETEGKWHAVRELRIGDRRITIRAHRLIVEARSDQRVSALDGNLLNCARANLHVRTLRPWTGRAGHSGFRGVHQINASRWSASIEFAGRQIDLGVFVDPEIAARAYDGAATKLYGINAQTNFRA